MFFPDLFKMAPLSEIAEAADKLTRNEIMSSNEIRVRLGIKPSKDEGADELRNKNLNKEKETNDNDREKETAGDSEA
jgi:hypothetical protein